MIENICSCEGEKLLVCFYLLFMWVFIFMNIYKTVPFYNNVNICTAIIYLKVKNFNLN